MNFCIGGQQVRIGFFCWFMEGKIHPLAPSYYRFLHRHTVIIGVGLLKLVEGDRIPAIIEFAPLHINAVDPGEGRIIILRDTALVFTLVQSVFDELINRTVFAAVAVPCANDTL